MSSWKKFRGQVMARGGSRNLAVAMREYIVLEKDRYWGIQQGRSLLAKYVKEMHKFYVRRAADEAR